MLFEFGKPGQPVRVLAGLRKKCQWPIEVDPGAPATFATACETVSRSGGEVPSISNALAIRSVKTPRL
ncbi:MAG TPA: hypothetical protein DDY91_02835 [Planctomycetaceae bacterium]|nr:hypothetical protein [Planctomycetaceae bacterium]